MKVLHIFDRWLNQTMNWAYHPMASNGVENHIAALNHVKHPFDQSHLHIAKSPIQSFLPLGKNEWDISWTQKAYGRFFRKNLQQFLREYVVSQKIELVHIHFANVGVVFQDFIQQIEVPFVVSFYGYDYEKVPLNNPDVIPTYKWMFRHASQIITEGDHGKSVLEKMGCPLQQISVIPLGIQLGDRKENKSKPSNSLHLVQAATLTPKKGHMVTLDALDKLQLSNLHCTFIGEQDDVAYSNEVLNRIHSSPYASYKPFVPFHQFDDAISPFDVLIQPSEYAPDRDCEGGAPLTLIHAQALGLPILSTQHCDIPNVVQNGKTGILVTEGDSDALARAIETFHQMDPSEYSNWSSRAIDNAHTNFDVWETGRKIFELYSSLGA